MLALFQNCRQLETKVLSRNPVFSLFTQHMSIHQVKELAGYSVCSPCGISQMLVPIQNDFQDPLSIMEVISWLQGHEIISQLCCFSLLDFFLDDLFPQSGKLTDALFTQHDPGGRDREHTAERPDVDGSRHRRSLLPARMTFWRTWKESYQRKLEERISLRVRTVCSCTASDIGSLFTIAKPGLPFAQFEARKSRICQLKPFFDFENIVRLDVGMPTTFFS